MLCKVGNLVAFTKKLYKTVKPLEMIYVKKKVNLQLIEMATEWVYIVFLYFNIPNIPSGYMVVKDVIVFKCCVTYSAI